jgi:hypothetical protein
MTACVWERLVLPAGFLLPARSSTPPALGSPPRRAAQRADDAPVRMRPRIDTLPVNGHFLSM